MDGVYNICVFVCVRRMTLQELRSLVEKMQNLPCVMSQLEEVQVSPLKQHQPISASGTMYPINPLEQNTYSDPIFDGIIAVNVFSLTPCLMCPGLTYDHKTRETIICPKERILFRSCQYPFVTIALP